MGCGAFVQFLVTGIEFQLSSCYGDNRFLSLTRVTRHQTQKKIVGSNAQLDQCGLSVTELFAHARI